MWPAAGNQDWHQADWFKVWLHLMRYQNFMKNPNERENPPERTPLDDRPDAIPAVWPGDDLIKPGVYPDKDNDETTIIPLVR
jgi:hypothetical protein